MPLVSVREERSRITHFRVTGEADRVRITWEAIPDASEYEVIVQHGDEEQRLLVIESPITFPARMFLEPDHGRLRIRPGFPSGGRGQWSDWLVIGPDGSQLVSDASDPDPTPQLHLSRIQPYRANDEAHSTVFRADFVTAADWAQREQSPDTEPLIAHTLLIAGPFVTHGAGAPHPNTGAIAWLSAYTTPGKRWATGEQAHLFAGASVADLEAYVTRWQGTIYDARPIP